MAQAQIDLEVLEDGTIRWKTGRIPDEHHNIADEFQLALETELGGEVQRTSKAGKTRHVHHHGDGRVHSHGD